MTREEEAYQSLCAYTLSRGDPAFIHQHVMDAYAAQTAKSDDKPIRLAFALAGLYLHLEKGFSGRDVQLAHMQIARRRQTWPRFPLPVAPGRMTSLEITGAAEGPERDEKIHQWCESVWEAFRAESETTLATFLRENRVC